MADCVEDHVRSVVAGVLDAPPDFVRPETPLSLADLGWKGLLQITLEIEHKFGIPLPIEVPNSWTTVADIVIATEAAIVARRRATTSGVEAGSWIG
jgi:acyl carrier protein